MSSSRPLHQAELHKIRNTLNKRYTVKGRPVTISRPAPKGDVVESVKPPIVVRSVKDRTENRNSINESSVSDVSKSSEDAFVSQYTANAGKSTDNTDQVIISVNESSMSVKTNKNAKSMPELDKSNSMEIDNQSTNESFERPRKTIKLTEPKNNPPVVKLTNKFGLLNPDDQVPSTSMQGKPPVQTGSSNKNAKKKWAPPIVIEQKVSNYKEFTNTIRDTINSDNFSVKFGRGIVKVFVTNMEDHELLVQALDRDNAMFYSYMSNDIKLKKIVLKAAPNMEANDIISDMKEKNFAVTECIPLKNKNNSEPFSYLLSLPNNTEINEVRKLNTLGNLKISWERYSKQRNWTQCHRCQAFGHGETYCYRKPRCVKCLEQHHTKNCPMQRTADSVPRCVNCKGEHTANYTKCPTLLEYLERRDGNRQPTNQQEQLNQNPRNARLNTHNRPPTQYGNMKYSDAVRGNQNTQPTNQRPQRPVGGVNDQANPNELRDLLKELKEINEIMDIGKFIHILRQLKTELRQCTNTTDKLMVMLRYIDIFE